jgi:hypothetical protein
MPHFEKVTQIKTDNPAATAIGGQNGVNHAGKKAVTRQVRSRYRKAGRKEKSAILDEFIRITGYKNRKYALRVLNKPETTDALIVVKGKAVKLKPAEKKPANRKGKKIYPAMSSLPSASSGPSFGTSAGSFRLPLCVSRWIISPCGRLSASLPASGKS